MTHPSPPLLFLLADPGETFALQPVLSLLTERGVEFGVVAVGAAVQLVDRNVSHVPFGSVTNVRFVLTGMSSRELAEEAARLKGGGSRVISYFEGFSPLLPTPIRSAFMEIADEIWVAAGPTAHDVHAHWPGRGVQVVGNPSLEMWERTPREAKGDTARRVVLVAGASGGEAYEWALTMFADAVRSRDDVTPLVSFHPKSNGAIEARVLQGITWTRVPEEFSTREAAAGADVVVCHRSTIAVQALAMEKPVVHIDVPTTPYTNLAIEAGLVTQATNADAMRRALDQPLSPAADLYERLQIPRGSKGLMVSAFVPLRSCH